MLELAHHMQEHVLIQEAMTCGAYDQMAVALGEKWKEFPAFGGLEQKGFWTVLFVNAETGSWTVLMIKPDGEACVAAAGASGQTIAAPAPGTDG